MSDLTMVPGVELHKLSEPSLPKAIAFGRSLVTTPFFGFLDDDDELLPESLDKRLEVLNGRPDVDFVVTNGIRRKGTSEEMVLEGLSSVPDDPLSKLVAQNWLASCGALFRTTSVGTRYFDDYHKYAEWTWLAYRLSIDGKRLAVIDEPTYVINETPGSLSTTSEYQRANVALYRRMLALDPPSHVRRLIRDRYTKAVHDLSDHCLRHSRLAEATLLHLKSLVAPGGLRYLPYSRHIAKAALKETFK